MPIDEGLAGLLVDRSVERCAEEHFSGDVRRARLALLRGDCLHCECVARHLIPLVAEILDRDGGPVRAVFRLGPPGLEETAPAAQVDRSAHLVVWLSRKTASIQATARDLESELSAARVRLGCPSAGPGCNRISFDLIDDDDVREARGLGLLGRLPGLAASTVWEAADRPPAFEQDAAPGPSAHRLPETFDPDLMPASRLIEHALSIERLDPGDRAPLEHHLTELKVTLIRKIISDQLAYIDIAKRWFDAADLEAILRHRIGRGKIGGKAAGMLLAGRVLRQATRPEAGPVVTVPESYYLGSDLMYIFMAMNGLMHWNDQKYKTEDEIHADYPRIVEEFERGEFPPELRIEIEAMLAQIGRRPLIVRSSSQLEDRLGTSFAGKYDSHFCPNQGTPEENLNELILAVSRTYASTFKPDALLYRRSRGLQDYDERMAVLIQPVEGQTWGRYYFPFAAGVGFSRNLYRWSDRIRAEDGFCRLVWGLGTRAVERLGTDYARLVALSHPGLQPDGSPRALRYYSQQFVDVIDLDRNRLTTLPVGDVLTPDYPAIRFLVQLERDGTLVTPRMRLTSDDMPNLVVNFERFLGRTRFAGLVRDLLQDLEGQWASPVDVEFTVGLTPRAGDEPELRLAILQCRPLPELAARKARPDPVSLAPEDVILSSRSVVFDGHLPDVRHVLVVDPGAYFSMPSQADRRQVARVIGRLNRILPPKTFICVGPGRWGTENLDLGVMVGYSDICNAGALVELSGGSIGPAAEPSLGTHFFHDLLEAMIYPVAVDLDRPGTVFREEFFLRGENLLAEVLQVDEPLLQAVRLIRVSSFRPGHHMELLLDAEAGSTVAYLVPDEPAPPAG